MNSDTEGGNIWLYSPSGNEWQMDAYDENFRLYNAETYNSMRYDKNGVLHVTGDVITGAGTSLNSFIETSETITLSVHCTLMAGAQKIWKIGKMCFFSMIVTVNGNGYTNALGIATLPSGFEPVADFAIDCPVWGDSSKERGTCLLYYNNRNLYFYAPSDTTRTYAITGSYMTI